MEYKLIHTGQHYDYEMSKIFFDGLGIPEPDIYLNIGSASHAVQTAKIMIGFEKEIQREKPKLLIVVGDVNSTLACVLVAANLNIKTAHIESGLRSFDRKMPEEINRLLTDQISDYLFTSEPSGKINLLKEGIAEEKIFYVGNIMIDTLITNIKKVKELSSTFNKLAEKKEMTAFSAFEESVTHISEENFPFYENFAENPLEIEEMRTCSICFQKDVNLLQCTKCNNDRVHFQE